MRQFIATTKNWGNSLGITIPSDVVRLERIKAKTRIMVIVMGTDQQKKKLVQSFGTLKHKRNKSTDQIMREIDEGYDEH